MDSDYMYYKKIVKSKRQRERNWDRNEKKALLRLVQRYRPIIDNKGNDNVWVRRKNAAWEAIQRGMVAEGFRRGVKSVRSQWARTKGEANRKIKNVKVDEDAGQDEEYPPAAIPILNEDMDPLGCIVKTEECEGEPLEMSLTVEDKIITPKIESDDDDQICVDNLISVDSILTSITSPRYEHTESSGIGSTTPSTNESAAEPTLPPPRPAERKLLPRIPVSRNVLHARLRQIEEETTQKAEIHSLEVTHRLEMHALRVQQMRENIEQQRRLFEAQLAKLQE